MSKKTTTTPVATVEVTAPLTAGQEATLAAVEQAVAAPAAPKGKGRKAKAQAPIGLGIVQASVSDVLAALYPEDAAPFTGRTSIALSAKMLGRPLGILLLPNGSRFCTEDGRVMGTLHGMDGAKASVTLANGAHQLWESDRVVWWMPTLPASESLAPSQPGAMPSRAPRVASSVTEVAATTSSNGHAGNGASGRPGVRSVPTGAKCHQCGADVTSVNSAKSKHPQCSKCYRAYRLAKKAAK